MRRWMAWILALLLCMGAAAEGLGSLSDYLAAVRPAALGAEGDWTREAGGRLLSVRPSKDALVTLCAEGDALLAVSVTAPKGEICERLARLALTPGGWIGEAKLQAMLEDGSSGTVNGTRLTRLEGELREGVCLCAEEGLEDLVWQPLHGGEFRHRSPECSGMDVPRLISSEAADALGRPPCSTCMGP